MKIPSANKVSNSSERDNLQVYTKYPAYVWAAKKISRSSLSIDRSALCPIPYPIPCSLSFPDSIKRNMQRREDHDSVSSSLTVRKVDGSGFRNDEKRVFEPRFPRIVVSRITDRYESCYPLCQFYFSARPNNAVNSIGKVSARISAERDLVAQREHKESTKRNGLIRVCIWDTAPRCVATNSCYYESVSLLSIFFSFIFSFFRDFSFCVYLGNNCTSDLWDAPLARCQHDKYALRPRSSFNRDNGYLLVWLSRIRYYVIAILHFRDTWKC